jgi:acetylornithine/N-succinyldiaminopimelate aminotransferase
MGFFGTAVPPTRNRTMLDHLMTTYARLPVAFDHGEGAYLVDTEGRRYLDAVTGVAVCGLGHAHPAVAEALCAQASRLVHTSNLYRVPLQEELAADLARLSGMERVFFANSGAESLEAAIKLARLYGHGKGIATPTVVVMESSFHGRTLATLTATGNPKVQQGFEPLVEGFVRVPYGDLAAIEALAAERGDIVAVLVEPVQGEGGVNVPPQGYLAGIRRLCDAQGWLMMLDEVQTGMGRTGAWFAFQHEGIVPDVMSLAKALGNGVPIGACLARGAAAEVLRPGTHGSTFGGNPLACAAARAVIRTLEEQDLVARARALGARLLDGLRAALDGLPGVVEVRGKGLILGVELDRPCGELVGRALEAGVLINVTAGKVIRLLPPLTLDDADAQRLLDTVVGLVRELVTVPAEEVSA